MRSRILPLLLLLQCWQLAVAPTHQVTVNRWQPVVLLLGTAHDAGDGSRLSRLAMAVKHACPGCDGGGGKACQKTAGGRGVAAAARQQRGSALPCPSKQRTKCLPGEVGAAFGGDHLHTSRAARHRSGAAGGNRLAGAAAVPQCSFQSLRGMDQQGACACCNVQAWLS